MQLSLRARTWALYVHRYVGLVMATFLLVAGLTGAMMAFYVPLDRMLNPELFVPTPAPGAQLLDPITIRDKLNEQLPPEQKVHGVALRVKPDETINYWVDGKETFVDPYTGAIVGARTFGDPREGRKSLLTFLYVLHFSLALGDVGHLLFGIVALLWTLDCFIGAYLTFPQPAQRKGPAKKAWLARWLPAWQLKTNKMFTAIFTWHRASGLWVWMMLLVFAWSAVALNLSPVYDAVHSLAFGTVEHEDLPELAEPIEQPPIPERDALALGRTLMATEAKQRGFSVLGEVGFDWLDEHGAFVYTVESTLDVDARFAGTSISYTPEGKLLHFEAALGQDAGQTFTTYLIALHFGAIREGGTPFRAFVCLMGFAVAALSVSGVWIWWKKRRTRAAGVKKAKPVGSSEVARDLEVVSAARTLDAEGVE